MKDELGGKIMKECVALRPKTYNYLTDGRCIYKKAKDTKKSNFRTRKECLESNKTILRSQQWFSSGLHNLFKEKINKIALSTKDNMRLETIDK